MNVQRWMNEQQAILQKRMASQQGQRQGDFCYVRLLRKNGSEIQNFRRIQGIFHIRSFDQEGAWKKGRVPFFDKDLCMPFLREAQKDNKKEEVRTTEAEPRQQGRDHKEFSDKETVTQEKETKQKTKTYASERYNN